MFTTENMHCSHTREERGNGTCTCPSCSICGLRIKDEYLDEHEKWCKMEVEGCTSSCHRAGGDLRVKCIARCCPRCGEPKIRIPFTRAELNEFTSGMEKLMKRSGKGDELPTELL